MDARTESPEEICTRGQAIYDNRIKGLVDPAHKGKFVAIDVDTGEYENRQERLGGVPTFGRPAAECSYPCC